MTEIDTTNPKDMYGLRKVPIRLVPGPAIVALAHAMQHGAEKYGEYNFRHTRVRVSIYIEAAQRHLLAMQDGEENDPESGQPHVAHAMACMAIIIDAAACGNLVDDRPHEAPTAEMIRGEI